MTKVPSNNYLDEGEAGYLRIIGDGRTLWENMMLDKTTRPMKIEVDVSGVTNMTVEMRGLSLDLGWDSMEIIFADAVLLNNRRKRERYELGMPELREC